MIKLAVCIPCYGDTKAKFTLSLSQALIHFMECRLLDHEGNNIPREVEIFMVSCSMLTESRHRLVGEALSWGATHLLWLDADHVFPADAIPRLLAHNVDVVGANYARRSTPTAPTACRLDRNEDSEDIKNLVYTTLEKAENGVLEEVAHLGFGVCLMNMSVLDMLQIHAEQTGDGNFMPLFEMKATQGKHGMIGEDVFFFGKCREAGAKIFCDHGLSWEVGHIGEMILTNAHANNHRERWTEKHQQLADRYRQQIETLEAAE
jgi:hypothetical protein